MAFFSVPESGARGSWISAMRPASLLTSAALSFSPLETASRLIGQFEQRIERDDVLRFQDAHACPAPPGRARRHRPDSPAASASQHACHAIRSAIALQRRPPSSSLHAVAAGIEQLAVVVQLRRSGRRCRRARRRPALREWTAAAPGSATRPTRTGTIRRSSERKAGSLMLVDGLRPCPGTERWTCR